MSYPVVKFGDVIDVLSGFAFKSEFFRDSEGFPIIRIRDVVRGYTDTYYIGPYGQQYVIQNDDIIIGMDGNFNAARWRGGPALLNQRVCKVTARCELIDEGYLFHYLPIALKKIEDATPFVTVKHLSAGDLKEATIPLPSLPEQRRIAAILDKADVLIAKRRQALAQLDRLAQSVFMEMFGDSSGTNLTWPEVMLGDVASTLTGYAFRSEEYVSESRGAIKLCRGANVSPKRMDWSDTAWWPVEKSISLDSFQLEPGDVVLAMDRPWISEGFKIARITEQDCPSLLVQRVTRLRGGRKANANFIYNLLLQPGFTRHCRPTETTIPHISPKEIRSFKFRLPPMELQEEFHRRVSVVEEHLKKSRLSLVFFDNLFASLQHRAFLGEL